MQKWIIQKLDNFILCIRSRLIDRAMPFIYSSLIGLLVGSKGFPPPLSLIEVIIISFSISMSVYIFNDIMEIDLDRLNRVNRPIAQGRVSKKDAASLVALLVILAVVLSFLINAETLLLSTTFLTLGFFYSLPKIYLKKRFLAKQIVASIGGAISSWIGGSAIGVLSPHVLYAGFLFSMLCFAGSPLGDLADVIGDRQRGIKSITVLYGPESGIKFSIICFLSTILITIFGYQHLGFNIITPIIITGSGLAFAFFAYPLLKNWQNREFYDKTIKRMVMVNFLYQISLILGVL